MSDEPLDQRPHQPTETHLQQLRTKGEVPSASEMQGAIRAVITVGAAVALFPAALAIMIESVSYSLQSLFGMLSGANSVQINKSAFSIWPVGLIALTAILSAFIASIFDRGGFLLRENGIKPSVKQLNPVAGVKEWFTLDAGYRFALGAVKLVTYTFVIGGLLRYLASSILWGPTCGLACELNLAIVIMLALLACHILIQLVIGLADLKISRLLFRRQHRMSLKQIRREMRDNYGSPEMKGAVRSFQHDDPMPPSPGNLYLRGAGSIYVLSVPQDMTAPIILTAAETGAAAAAREASAAAASIPVIAAGTMEQELAGLAPGSTLPPVLAAQMRLAIFRMGQQGA